MTPRSLLFTALSLTIAACGSAGPNKVVSGPHLEATLKASWPAEAPARQATFSRDGNLLATSDASGTILIRKTKDWKIVERLKHDGGATSVAFAPNGTHLFSGGYDGTVRDWDLGQIRLARKFRGPIGTVWTIALSPDGEQLAASGEDRIIRIWNLSSNRRPFQLKGHQQNVWQVAFSPNGRQVASGSFDNSVRLWNAQTGQPVKILKGHTQAIVGLDYSPNGRMLVSGGDDSTIRFWRASDGAALRLTNSGLPVDTVAFSPDGRWLASGGHARGTVGTLWHQLTGSGSDGDSVRIWRVADGALVGALPHADDVVHVAFSPNGRWLVTSGEDNRFRLWALRPVG